MRLLFIHNNFPAQFGQLGQTLAGEGHDVSFLTRRRDARAAGIRTFIFPKEEAAPRDGVHPFLKRTDEAVRTGTAALRAMKALRKRGYQPDIVVAHSGWGPGLFVREVWPEAVYVAYCEWYYRGDAEDFALAKGEPATIEERAREHVRNTPILLDLAACDHAIVPTRYQASRFPAEFKSKISVLHDGIDDDFFSPGPAEPVSFGGLRIAPGDEVLTYATRGMEPYRGFPDFMRALAILQKKRPAMKTVILGSDRVVYGKKLPEGESWMGRMRAELDLDESRIAAPGHVRPSVYRNVLRLSSVHCYLTYPFVLSWSLLDAMSCGCLVVASDTEPVREVMKDGQEGLLCTMDDPADIARIIGDALNRRATLGDLPKRARDAILRGYARRDQVAAKKALFARLIAEKKAGRS